MGIKFLSETTVKDIHDFVIEKYGGLNGIIKDKNISATLNRIHWHIEYGELDKHQAIHIATKYAVAISQGHIFIDGNKRTAFLAMATFLKENNIRCDLEQDDVVQNLERLAQRNMSEEEFEGWLNSSLQEKITAHPEPSL